MSHNRGEATKANPASRSRTSHVKTHRCLSRKEGLQFAEVGAGCVAFQDAFDFHDRFGLHRSGGLRRAWWSHRGPCGLSR